MASIDSFRAATPARQMLLVLLAALLLGGILIAGYFALFRIDYKPLFTDLRTMDAATIVAELDRKKIPYVLKEGGSTILVPEPQVDATRLEVMGANLPLKGVVGFELFNESDMGLTEFAQKINYQRALQGELARTIMTLDTIDTARVHLAMGERTLFRGDRSPPKASITLLTRPGKRLSPEAILGIQRLVAAAVPDLDLANVVIVDDAGRTISASAQTTPDVPAIEGDAYYAAQVGQAVEKIYPGMRLRIKVSAGPQTLVPAPAAQPDAQARRDPVASLAPGPGLARSPLLVDIVFLDPQPEAVRSAVRSIASTALGLDAASGDIVAISEAPVARPASPPIPVAAPDAASGAPTVAGGAPWYANLGWVALAALLLAAILFGARRRTAASHALTDDERQAFADRLRDLLEPEERSGGQHV